MISICRYDLYFLRLQGIGLLEQALELSAGLQALDVRVTTNVLLLDVDVGNGALARDFL